MSWAARFWLAFFCLLLLAGPCGQTALADNWRASLPADDTLPPHLVGVDKERKTFLFFEKKSPLKLKYRFACTTGQLAGDKQALNDLRTPEGIYFVEYKIASGLDFREYGGIAYTLNYPNPVDRLRGKTGHGIWIHSKGYGLVPTRGCVAIDLKDIGTVGPQLTPGTAVVLAEQMDEKQAGATRNGATASKLRRMMQDWSDAWAARSRKMFDFYDPESYSRGTENFSAFRANKERLFSFLSYIRIYNREIHVLEGPGYWVTWAEQFYTASNLSTEGIRRLYWQEDRNGKFRIVGMEWTPRDVGMHADFRKGKLVASTSRIVSDATSEAPNLPRLDMPEAPDQVSELPAVIGQLAAVAEATVQKDSPDQQEPVETPSGQVAPVVGDSKAASALVENRAEEKQPAGQDQAGPSAQQDQVVLELARMDPLVAKPSQQAPSPEINWGGGQRFDQRVGQQAESANAPASAMDGGTKNGQNQDQPGQKPGQDGKQNESGAAKPTASQADSVPANNELPAEKPLTNQEIAELARRWVDAYSDRSPHIDQLYDSQNYNRVKGVPRGLAYQTELRNLGRRFASKWLTVLAHDPVIELHKDHASSKTGILTVGPDGMEQGERILCWKRDSSGQAKIVSSSFRPAELGMAAEYLETASSAVTSMVEAWRKAWEKADIDTYISFYENDANQQGRRSAAAIRKQKQDLWARVKPEYVRFSGFRLMLEKKGIRVEMEQEYADGAGRKDEGIKILLLRFDGENWKINNEGWAKSGQAIAPALAPPAQVEQPDAPARLQVPARRR